MMPSSNHFRKVFARETEELEGTAGAIRIRDGGADERGVLARGVRVHEDVALLGSQDLDLIRHLELLERSSKARVETRSADDRPEVVAESLLADGHGLSARNRILVDQQRSQAALR